MRDFLVKLPRGTEYWSMGFRGDDIVIFPENVMNGFQVEMRRDTAKQIYDLLDDFFRREIAKRDKPIEDSPAEWAKGDR